MPLRLLYIRWLGGDDINLPIRPRQLQKVGLPLALFSREIRDKFPNRSRPAVL
jgi:hypothetical protein